MGFDTSSTPTFEEMESEEEKQSVLNDLIDTDYDACSI